MLNRAEMLNRRAGHPRFKAYEIIKALAIIPGTVVADIGCGGGFFTMRFAEAVGLDGRVYAADSNKKFLDYVKNHALQHQMTNVTTMLVDEKGVNLPEHGCDLIFLRNVVHHIEDRKSYCQTLKKYLKPGGRVVIIDYKKRKSMNFITWMGHYVEEEEIKQMMREAGYELAQGHDFLPEQSFTVYRVAEISK